MIKRKADMKVDRHEDFLGGTGELFFHHFMNQEESGGMGRLFCKTVIPAGGSSIGIHKHNGDFECYYILSGKAELFDNGKTVILEAGDVNICPDGQEHGIKNIGDEELVYIAIILFTKQKEIQKPTV